MGPDDLQRRVLLGRYATREGAESARLQLGPAFSTARVIPGAQERLRIIIPAPAPTPAPGAEPPDSEAAA